MSIAQGVSPERGDDLGLTPLVGNMSASSLRSSGSILFFLMESRGRARTACTLDHLPMLFRPHAGAVKFGGHSPAGCDIFLISPHAGRSEIAAAPQ